MARITISDTLPFVKSKYELGMLAGQRVRDLNGGEEPIIAVNDNDKPTVTALREIASGRLNVEDLRKEFIQSYKKMPVADEKEETLESNAIVPELKELDAELSGEAQKREEVCEAVEEESEANSEPESSDE